MLYIMLITGYKLYFILRRLLLNIFYNYGYCVIINKGGPMLWIKCALMASIHYNIPMKVIVNIVRVESRYCTMSQNVPNSNGTFDHGCMQINDVTIEHYRLSKTLVRQDRCYNIWHGVRILADLKRRFPETWACRWHVGSAYLTAPRARRCARYLDKLALK